MEPKLKEYLYLQLRNIQQQLEDRDIRGAMLQVEGLINKIQYDRL
jgi:sensor domain CHASE-containing protein